MAVHRPARRPAPAAVRGPDHARPTPAAPAAPTLPGTVAAGAPPGRGQLTEADKADLFRRFSEWESRGSVGPAGAPGTGPAEPASGGP